MKGHETLKKVVEAVGYSGLAYILTDRVENMRNWDEDTRKKWVKNVRRGLISIDCDYLPEERGEIWELYYIWSASM